MKAVFPVCLPDFRNLGVLLRIVLWVEFAKLFLVCVANPNWAAAWSVYLIDSLLYEPILLLTLSALYFAGPLLALQYYRIGILLVVFVVMVAATVWFAFVSQIFGESVEWSLPRILTVASLMAFSILCYFNWRYRVLSPALSEARLMALQARIRPHFLFNSLNTVLGLMRVEPRRAENVLENLAELYRALLSESGTLVSLGRELELARAYAEIETTRLGSRLTVHWQCQGAPLNAMVPPLLLQPLLENAVYHGVEPSESGGTVDVTVFLKGEQLSLVVRNPCESSSLRQSGNRMALNNIRERLALHFDAEAEMSAYEAGGEFVVQIRIPYKHG